jgi:hypothetical protein|tara:strand:- start:469 stop:693 length:225 start_codon:yes stop_codon:yes gene_type:complete
MAHFLFRALKDSITLDRRTQRYFDLTQRAARLISKGSDLVTEAYDSISFVRNFCFDAFNRLIRENANDCPRPNG